VGHAGVNRDDEVEVLDQGGGVREVGELLAEHSDLGPQGEGSGVLGPNHPLQTNQVHPLRHGGEEVRQAHAAIHVAPVTWVTGAGKAHAQTPVARAQPRGPSRNARGGQHQRRGRGHLVWGHLEKKGQVLQVNMPVIRRQGRPACHHGDARVNRLQQAQQGGPDLQDHLGTPVRHHQRHP